MPKHVPSRSWPSNILRRSPTYGVPALYLGNWIYLLGEQPALNTTERDDAAHKLTLAALDEMMALADNATIAASYRYYYSFLGVWNSTSSDAILVADPPSRAEYSIGVSAPVFVDNPLYPEEQKLLMLGVLSSFDLESFSNATLIHSFSMSTIATMSGISDSAFLEQVYALGPDYSYPEAAAFARQVVSTGTLSDYPVSLPAEYLAGFISPDNSTMLVVLSFSKNSGYYEGGEQPITDNVQFLRDFVRDARDAHLGSEYTVYVTGDAALTADMEASMGDEMMLIEPVTIVIIIVLMGIFFRSVVAQFVPLGSVMVALGVSQAILFFIGSYVADIVRSG